jgi:hypothetical protein
MPQANIFRTAERQRANAPPGLAITGVDPVTTQSSITLERHQIEAALDAHTGYYERARHLLRTARTDDDHAQAQQWMANAAGEIARWQAALEACEC